MPEILSPLPDNFVPPVFLPPIVVVVVAVETNELFDGGWLTKVTDDVDPIGVNVGGVTRGEADSGVTC